MRAHRTSWAAATLVALAAPSLAKAQDAAYILNNFKPSIQGVEFDTPAGKDEVAACKVDQVFKDGPDGKKLPIGFAVRDAQGKLLRRFVDTNLAVSKRENDAKPTTHLDQWSYYRDGFEVYRENDTNEDGALDEVRWLNTGGTRVGEVKGGKVVGWKRISAEEASKVLVQAIIGGDLPLLESVMLKPEDAKTLGLPDAVAKDAADGAAARRNQVVELQKSLKGWNNQTTWGRFDGMMPHVIPAEGAGPEVLLYENAVIFVNGGEKADPRGLAYLHVPELVRVGDTWKFLSLPRAVDPTKPEVNDLAAGSLRQKLFGTDAGPADSNANDVPPELMQKLAEHDAKNPGADGGAKAIAQWHLDRIAILKELIGAARTPESKLNFYKLVVHDLAEAYKTGLYPDGAKVFDDLIGQGGKLGSFAAYRKILADFDLEADKPGANIQSAQEETVKQLNAFLEKYASSDEVPEVLFQLATVHEFNNAEDQAKTYYSRLAGQYAATEQGKRAAGALKRIELDGKPLALAGPSLSGKPASLADTKGKTTVVLFWMSATEPDRRELQDLADLYGRYRDKGFEVLSVNLDADRAALDGFLKGKSLPWPVIFEEGGLDSRLATEFGVISTPTMFLVDGQGQVVSHKIRKASEVEKYLEKPLASKPVGLNLKQ